MQEMHLIVEVILSWILSRLHHRSPTRHAALEVQSFVPFSVKKNGHLKSELVYASVCHCIMLYNSNSHTWQPRTISIHRPENNHHLVSVWMRWARICSERTSHINDCRLRNCSSLINLISNIWKQSILFVNGWIGKSRLHFFCQYVSCVCMRTWHEVNSQKKKVNLMLFVTSPTPEG